MGKKPATKKRVAAKKTPSKVKPVGELESRKATEVLAGVLAALSVLLAVMVIVATHRSQNYANMRLERFINATQQRLDEQESALTDISRSQPTTEQSSVTDVGGPLAFNLTDPNVKVTLTSFEVLDRFNPQTLENRSQDCGKDHPLGYFDALETDYAGAIGYEYILTYTTESQPPESYSVTVVPNATHYAQYDDFVADYDLCSAGGDAYPLQLSEDWLLFGSSCGTGYINESGLPVGCDEVRSALGDGIVVK